MVEGPVSCCDVRSNGVCVPCPANSITQLPTVPGVENCSCLPGYAGPTFQQCRFELIPHSLADTLPLAVRWSMQHVAQGRAFQCVLLSLLARSLLGEPWQLVPCTDLRRQSGSELLHHVPVWLD